MASIRIRVGAVLDPGATRVFDPLVAAAQRAAKAIARAGKEGAEEFVGTYRSAPAHAKKGFDETTRAAEKAAKDQAKAAEQAAKAEARAYEHVYQIKQRYLRQQERDEERVAQRRIAATRGIISSAGRTFGGVVRSGLGLAGEVARGAGVDLSVGSLVSRNVASHKTATDITNSAYVEGASGSVGQRQDPKAVIAAAKEAANAAGISEEVALAGLQKFVGKSTDLQTGMEMLKQMAILSKATGSSLEDMASAAGEVDLKLGNVPNKAKILNGLMATFAKQGQLAASEIRDMAPFIGRIVQSTNQFAGGSEKAAVELGAVFQIIKKEKGQTVGGATTATNRLIEALSSKNGMKGMFKPGTGIKESDIYDKEGKTRLPSEIIPKLLAATKGGDPREVAKMFSNTNAGKGLKAFAGTYQEGEKTGKGGGKKAVEALFSEYGGAMSQTQIQESLARAMGETEAKVQLFQNRLQAIADDNLPRVIASLERLAPVAAEAADGFGRFVAWASENPFQAVAGALAASVAKAALGSALEAGLAKALGGSAGLSITAATATVAGAALIYLSVQKEKKAGAEDVHEDVSTAAKDILVAQQEKKKGALSPEMREKLEKERDTLSGDLALGSKPVTTGEKFQALNPFSDTTVKGLGRHEGAGDTGFQADAAARIAEIDALIGKGADGHAKAAGELSKAAAALKDAAAGFNPVGGFGPGAVTPPVPLRQ